MFISQQILVTCTYKIIHKYITNGKSNNMKQKQLLLIFLTLFFFPLGIQAQSLIVQETDGYETSEALSLVRKLTFEQNNLHVHLKSGIIESYGLQQVRKLYFDTLTTAASLVPGTDEHLIVYPNPAGNLIMVDHIPSGTKELSVFCAEGSLAMQVRVNMQKETINLDGLKSGIYYIFANGRAAKFIRL
ncbi:protein containing Por secretion system C-terminal sorting domain [Lentimicrobium saccharophilum]|uniref:Protein containing Por secretion system C-terminal sorting domain n=2 Tax=Lentimicrobium saccharophilum TaxID=1678841 RepID=A0A0S7C333_9BACT|nr:protein containing Por secretion system C-terminal sorting domain [Lentimicrobium saccharophilum]